MKKSFCIISFLLAVLIAQSQNLTVEGKSPNLYIVHTVAPKENFYSVGRLYNQAPKSIASFNNLVMEKGLTIGQHIKIPLNAQNINESGNAGEAIPLTHIVAKSETLSKIGSDYNIPVQSLKQWNNLSSGDIAPGTPLVVGHLKLQSSAAGVVKTTITTEAKSSVAESMQNSAPINQPAGSAKDETAQTPAANNVAATATSDKTEVPSSALPVAKRSEAVADNSTKENSAQETILKKGVPKESAVKNAPAVKENVEKEAPLNANPAKTTSAKSNETSKVSSYSTTSSLGSVEGVFAGVFPADASQKSLNTKNGEAATFKSTSGWQDKKYYVLMNDVNPGTILKIATADDKVVYAKVLGSMPEMKENNGLLIRISSAAASYLGIIDPKFPVQISYYQ